MPRRKSLREKREGLERKPKGPYQKRDNIILRVAQYLVTKDEEGATIYNIISAKSQIGLSSQDQTRFTKKIMEPMEKDGWIKKRTYSKRTQVYVITEKGKSAISEALRLKHDGNLLSSLEAFNDIIR